MGRLAAPAEHASAPTHRMGQTALWRRRRDRRGATCRPREHFTSGWPRPGRIRAPDRAVGRHCVARGAFGEICAGGIAATAIRRGDGMVFRGSAYAAGRAGLRGPALGGPDVSRSHAVAGRTRRPGAAAHRGDDAAGVPAALGHALAPWRRFARAARSRGGPSDGRRDRKPACAFRRDDRRSRRANGRRPAFRRGSRRDSCSSAMCRAAPRRSRRPCSNRSPRG